MLDKPLIEIIDKVFLKRTKLLYYLVVERVIAERYILNKLNLIVVRPIRR